MADESAVPVAALPAVELRSYDVELAFHPGGSQPYWRVLGTFEAESTRAALDAHLSGESPLSASGVYRVVERYSDGWGVTRTYRVEPVVSVSDYEPPIAEAPSGDGGS